MLPFYLPYFGLIDQRTTFSACKKHQLHYQANQYLYAKFFGTMIWVPNLLLYFESVACSNTSSNKVTLSNSTFQYQGNQTQQTEKSTQQYLYSHHEFQPLSFQTNQLGSATGNICATLPPPPPPPDTHKHIYTHTNTHKFQSLAEAIKQVAKKKVVQQRG